MSGGDSTHPAVRADAAHEWLGPDGSRNAVAFANLHVEVPQAPAVAVAQQLPTLPGSFSILVAGK
jgi:hypothetical protein